MKIIFSKDKINKMKAEREEWEKIILNKFIIKGKIKEKFKTPSGITIKPIYVLDHIISNAIEFHSSLL